MDRKIDILLNKYGESHQNETNKAIHWVCVPLIMFNLVGLLMSIPFPNYSIVFNLATLVLMFALGYYLRLSLLLSFGLVFIVISLLLGNYYLKLYAEASGFNYVYVSLIIFLAAWIGQFYGHKVEGKKPSFLEDIQFLLIGPAWLLHFIYKKLGFKY
ncbi:MAG TPA: DUF962 domain-containing protein [Saprospiraceae bacterium]|nr:DUF962 domain-containing protein [Saprospiraceae bacterium]